MVTPAESCSIRGANPSEVGGAWGAAYAVGTPISALVTGICCALAIEYFQQFPQDATRIRVSVIVVVATTILGLLLAMDLTYVRLVKNVTPPGGFGDIPWQDDAVALICGICQLICSAYFANSAYSVAIKKKALIVWYGLLMAVIFLSVFFRAILGLTPRDWSDGATLCPKMTFLWLICSLLLDLSIALTLLTRLRKAVPTPPLRTAASLPAPSSRLHHSNNAWVVQQPQAPLLSRLLTTILTSFSLTAILMFSLLILVLAMHGTEFDPQLPKATGIFTALRLLATPTYAVTFLYTLNRRNRRAAVYPSSILNGQMQSASPRLNHNTTFPFQSPGTMNSHLLAVQVPITTCEQSWSNMLGTPSTRYTRSRNGKENNMTQMIKLDISEAFKIFSSASFRKGMGKAESTFPEPPLPIHIKKNQPELRYQPESHVQNFDSLNHNYVSDHGHPQAYHSSVQVYHGTAI